MRRRAISLTVLVGLLAVAATGLASAPQIDADAGGAVPGDYGQTPLDSGRPDDPPGYPDIVLNARGDEHEVADADPAAEEFTRVIQVMPPLAGVRIIVGGEELQSDPQGVIRVAAGERSELPVRVLPWTSPDSTQIAEVERWGDNVFQAERTLDVPGNDLSLGMRINHLITIEFVDLDGNPLDVGRVESMSIKSSLGNTTEVRAGEPTWLRGNRIIRTPEGGASSPVIYAIESVMVDGSNVVNRGQQRFETDRSRWSVEVLLYALEITVRDFIFGTPIISAVRLEYPNGLTQEFDLGPEARVALESLARGDYRATAVGGGVAINQPLKVTGNNRIELRVISILDILFVLGVGAILIVGLLVWARPGFRAWDHERTPLANMTNARFLRLSALRLCLSATILIAGALILVIGPRASGQEPLADTSEPPPVFAYYYIWFDETSWDRAKIDFPLLGRYSSDSVGVMRSHVQTAKAAGVNGFLVSWKSTARLNTRLRSLVDVAREEDFKLAIVYQGLDFERAPVSADLVIADLTDFAATYRTDPVFDFFPRPLVMLSGSWKFSESELSAITATARNSGLLILASERNVRAYEQRWEFFDGNSYYWASVNPETFPEYEEKLIELADAVHAHDGIWIAPAAPGFDARLVGGESVVERHDGATLLRQLAASIGAEPDVIGLISWNEFSENTHIEPSQAYGSSYVTVLANFLGDDSALSELGEIVSNTQDFDSSAPEGRSSGRSAAIAIGGIAALILTIAGIAYVRRTSRHPDTG